MDGLSARFLRTFWAKRDITLIARGMKLTRLCSHAPVAALLPARVGQVPNDHKDRAWAWAQREEIRGALDVFLHANTGCMHDDHGTFWAKRDITLIARGMKLTRLCSHAPVAALLPARFGQDCAARG